MFHRSRSAQTALARFLPVFPGSCPQQIPALTEQGWISRGLFPVLLFQPAVSVGPALSSSCSIAHPACRQSRLACPAATGFTYRLGPPFGSADERRVEAQGCTLPVQLSEQSPARLPLQRIRTAEHLYDRASPEYLSEQLPERLPDPHPLRAASLRARLFHARLFHTGHLAIRRAAVCRPAAVVCCAAFCRIAALPSSDSIDCSSRVRRFIGRMISGMLSE